MQHIRLNSIYREINVLQKKTYVHPHYNYGAQYDDIALIQLERRIPFNYSQVRYMYVLLGVMAKSQK